MADSHRVLGLSGGAKLITSPMPERLSASLVLMFGGGSRQEDDRLAGVSHFIEHLFFKGTRRRPTSKEIADAIEGVGGFINASTDKELTAYWARVPAEHLELGLDVLFAVVSNSKLLLEEIIWPNPPLGRDIAGTEQSVAQLTRDDILEYANAHYRLPNLVIGAAGAIDEQKTLDAVKSRLTLPVDPDGLMPSEPPGPLTAPHVVVRRRRTEQAHICLGVRALSYTHPDRYALDLLNTVLGEGMSSRLFLNIREHLGLAYDVHSFTQKHRDTGHLGVYLGVDPKKAVEAIQAVVAEMRTLCERDLSGEELQRAKEFTKGRLRLDLETTNGVAFWLTYQELLRGKIKTIEDELVLVDAVTASDIRRVADTLLASPMQMAVIGPFTRDAGFRAAIGA